MSYRKIIEELGGARAVAEALGVASVDVVYKWWRPGCRIPPDYWPAVSRLAEARRLGVTVEVLEHVADGPVRRRARAASTYCSHARLG